VSLSVPKLASYLAALLRENPLTTDDDLWARTRPDVGLS